MEDENNPHQSPISNKSEERNETSNDVPNISGIEQTDSISNKPLVNTPNSTTENFHVEFSIDDDDNQPNPSDNFAKLLKGNKYATSTKKSTATSAKSNHKRRYEESIKSTNYSHFIRKEPSTNQISNNPSLLKISGQKIIGESLTLIRPMKCFQYDTPETVSAVLPSTQPKAPVKRSITATSTLKRRQQLQKKQLQQIQMMQNNITIGFNSPQEIMTQKDLLQMRKDIAWIEKQKKLVQDAKDKRKNQQTELQEGEKSVYLSLPPAKFF